MSYQTAEAVNSGEVGEVAAAMAMTLAEEAVTFLCESATNARRNACRPHRHAYWTGQAEAFEEAADVISKLLTVDPSCEHCGASVRPEVQS
jgi:hypothetical protein